MPSCGIFSLLHEYFKSKVVQDGVWLFGIKRKARKVNPMSVSSEKDGNQCNVRNSSSDIEDLFREGPLTDGEYKLRYRQLTSLGVRRGISEKEVLQELVDVGIVDKDSIARSQTGNLGYYVPLDGNPLQDDKMPRVLETLEIDWKARSPQSLAKLNSKLELASRRREEKLKEIRRKSRIASRKRGKILERAEKCIHLKQNLHLSKITTKQTIARENRDLLECQRQMKAVEREMKNLERFCGQTRGCDLMSDAVDDLLKQLFPD